MNCEFTYKSYDPENTLLIGQKIGEFAETGQIILLKGELGSGKTVLVKGIARALDIEQDITSPTYVLINEYQGRLPLYHMDLYRLEQKNELYDIGFEEYLGRPGIVAIEWPELALDFIKDHYLQIEIEVIEKTVRKFSFKSRGKQSQKLLQNINY